MNRALGIVLLLPVLIGSSVSSNAQKVRGYNRPIDSLSSARKGIFSSMEGGYSISLPARVGGFHEGYFQWRLTEGYYSAGYFENAVEVESSSDQEAQALKRAHAVLAIFDELFETPIAPTHVTQKTAPIGGHYALELRAEFPNAVALVRTILVKRRICSVAVILVAEQRQYESLAKEVFDSFKLTPADEANGAIQRKVMAATPKPLPQEPVSPKMKTDAQDNKLQGRVKAVIEEVQGLTGRLAEKARRPSWEAHYNELGNLVKTILYSDAGHPLDITVYGYIDGSRVSSSGFITPESSPPPMMLPPSRQSKPRDSRYQTRYVHKYDSAGELIELLLYGNDGSLSSHIVYKRQGNKLEELDSTENGSLKLRKMSLLDGSGHETRQTYPDAPLKGWTEVYDHTYEFDKQGNWIRRFTTFTRTFNGRNIVDSTSVTYRIVTYY